MQKTIEFLLKKTNQGKWEVTAKVKDATSLTAIKGAKVEIIDFGSGLTDYQGIYRFANVPSDSYQVSAEKEGYDKQTKTLKLEEEAPIANLSGHVTEKDTGNTLETVKVTIDSQVTHTNRDGYYEFTGLSVGNHQVIFEKEGYETLIK